VYNNAAMVDGRFTEVTDSCGTGAEYASPGLPACVVAAPQGDDQRRFYRGNSMAGTFRPGDYLILEPVPIVAICPGDVVIYQGRDQEGEPDDVVHRVVGVVPGGLAARGDNNPTVDNILVTADNLLGRVRHFERDGKVYPVCGGRRGRLVAWVRHAWVHVRRYGDRVVRFLGRWPYRGLRRSGLVPRLWQPTITRIMLTTGDGPLVKYVSHGRTVAWWWPERGRFRCRRPYDLILTRPTSNIKRQTSGTANDV